MKPKECVKRTKAKYKSKEVGERNKRKKQNAKREEWMKQTKSDVDRGID
jgi:hypothetical protein